MYNKYVNVIVVDSLLFMLFYLLFSSPLCLFLCCTGCY